MTKNSDLHGIIRQLPGKDRRKAQKKSMPDWQDPMLAKLTHDYFSDKNWIYECKLDGERVISYSDSNGNVRLMSRNKKLLNDNYPEIEKALNRLAPDGCILDGEVVAFNKDNVSDFQRLQPRMQAPDRDKALKSRVKVYYYIFDCLYVDGHELTECSLRDRKKILKKAIKWTDPIKWTQHRNKEGIEYFKKACARGWEGLIAKDVNAAYSNGRSGKWLKFKCLNQQEFIICGFTDPEGERIGFGALLLGYYHNGNLIYAGQVGTGFDDKTLHKLHKKLQRYKRKTSPYGQGTPGNGQIHFVSPKLVCEVAFTEWTSADKLRHPRFKGLRRDKSPEKVRREDKSRKANI